MSTKPGIRYIPVPSISWSACGPRFCRIASPGVPALRTAVIRLPETTTSIGPAGGAPVPSISMTPRMTIVLNGPLPSSGRRSGAPFNPSRCGAGCAAGLAVGCWVDPTAETSYLPAPYSAKANRAGSIRAFIVWVERFMEVLRKALVSYSGSSEVIGGQKRVQTTSATIHPAIASTAK